MKRGKSKALRKNKTRNKRSRLRTRRQRGSGGCIGWFCSNNVTGVNEGAHRPPLTARPRVTAATLQAEPNTLTLNPMFNKQRRLARVQTDPVTLTLNPMFNKNRATLQAQTVRQPSLLPPVAKPPDMKTVELIKSGLLIINEQKQHIKNGLQRLDDIFTQVIQAAREDNTAAFKRKISMMKLIIDRIRTAISMINNNNVMIKALLRRGPTLNPETYNYEIENVQFNYNDYQNLFKLNNNFGNHPSIMNQLITLLDIGNLMLLIQQDTAATAATAATAGAFPPPATAATFPAPGGGSTF